MCGHTAIKLSNNWHAHVGRGNASIHQWKAKVGPDGPEKNSPLSSRRIIHRPWGPWWARAQSSASTNLEIVG